MMKKFQQRLEKTLVLGLAALSLPLSAGAAITGIESIKTLTCTIRNWVFTFALIIGVIYILIAAVKYMNSGGDASKVSEVHRAVIWAAIGIGVALVAAAVPSLVGSFLGAGDVSNGC